MDDKIYHYKELRMDFIKGVTFAPFASKGQLSKKETYESFDKMLVGTGADFVILVPNGLQDTPQSEYIDFTSDATMSDDELIAFIRHAKSKHVRVALKPTVNCKNGTWRAHINFFDEDVPCEPKWSNWFEAYTRFQLHYAVIAEECGCDMFIAGCEMVQTERRETEWRKLIADIRTVYSGPVSYNTDKYQEHNVKWWDCVDWISSSGYYPIEDWENQLDRIEKVVQKFNKPFFFAECGCMSTEGSNHVPNDWSIKGEVDVKGQADWYHTMFTACNKRNWVLGFCLWDWGAKLYPAAQAGADGRYGVYAKPAEQVVREFYCSK